MLQFLPLPGLWLMYYILGQLPARGSVVARRYLIAGASLILLFFAVGVRTFTFYASLGLAIILLGLLLQSGRSIRARKALFVCSIAGVVLVIALFLNYRVYLQKYFPSIPSLSYLGFRGIAYLVSAYALGTVSLSSGMMQMFFLPMLFMGPIARVENFHEERHDQGEVLRRLARAFPMLIAGHLIGSYVLQPVVLPTRPACWEFWLGAVANSFEFYLTFAGYTHLAIGLGLLAGFKLPENFNNPYLSTSISDFWRRWHMSLSFWIRDYLYIPLGGNRKGISRKCLNLLFAMAICGLWHGLAWHYLLWGLFHGALLCIESLMAHQGWHPLRRSLGRVYVPVKVAIIFSLVTFSWLLFKYELPALGVYLRGLIP